jgi:hypothetical protein
MVRRLRRRKPKGGQMSLRSISAELAAAGHVNELGRPFSAKSVRAMLTAGGSHEGQPNCPRPACGIAGSIDAKS